MGIEGAITFPSLQATPLQYQAMVPVIAVSVFNNGRPDIIMIVIEEQFSITASTSRGPLLQGCFQ